MAVIESDNAIMQRSRYMSVTKPSGEGLKVTCKVLRSSALQPSDEYGHDFRS